MRRDRSEELAIGFGERRRPVGDELAQRARRDIADHRCHDAVGCGDGE